jgi:hypothetical protein
MTTEIAATAQQQALAPIKWPYAESVIKERAEKYNRLIISDNRSYNATKAARTEFVSIRTSIDKALKEGNKPLNDMIKRNRDEAKRLIELAKPTEDYLQDQVKAWEDKKEQERQAKIEAERQRVAAIQARINAIRTNSIISRGATSESIRDTIDHVQLMVIDESFEEFEQAAYEAKSETLSILAEALAYAEQQEKEAAERKAESERLAAEAERQRIERESLEAERKAEEERIARQRAEFEAEQQRQRDEIERQKAELAAQQQAIEGAKREKEDEMKKECLPESKPVTLHPVETETCPTLSEKHEADRKAREFIDSISYDENYMSCPGLASILSTLCDHYGITLTNAATWILMASVEIIERGDLLDDEAES